MEQERILMFLKLIVSCLLFTGAGTLFADSSSAASTWATINKSGPVRSGAGDGYRSVTSLNSLTPNGSQGVVRVIGRKINDLGDQWVKVQVPGRRSRSGWVPSSRLGDVQSSSVKVVVSTKASVLTVYRHNRKAYQTKIGHGRAKTPTAKGSFIIAEQYGAGIAPYGPVAFGTTGRAPGGSIPGLGSVLGIHGMNGLGRSTGKVSNGCIRVPNITKLAAYLEVGALVVIR